MKFTLYFVSETPTSNSIKLHQTDVYHTTIDWILLVSNFRGKTVISDAKKLKICFFNYFDGHYYQINSEAFWKDAKKKILLQRKVATSDFVFVMVSLSSFQTILLPLQGSSLWLICITNLSVQGPHRQGI